MQNWCCNDCVEIFLFFWVFNKNVCILWMAMSYTLNGVLFVIVKFLHFFFDKQIRHLSSVTNELGMFIGIESM